MKVESVWVGSCLEGQQWVILFLACLALWIDGGKGKYLAWDIVGSRSSYLSREDLDETLHRPS
jgi:hypothetical protein